MLVDTPMLEEDFSIDLPNSVAPLAHESEVEAILKGQHGAPHAFLGMHPYKYGHQEGVVIRTFIKDAQHCTAITADSEGRVLCELEQIDMLGFFMGFTTQTNTTVPYKLRVVYKDGSTRSFADPYSFLPTLNEEDQYLFGEGNHHHIHDRLGCHFRKINGVSGFSFAVWAPSAQRVSVVGDFNHWDGRYYPMRSLGASGIWEIFIPGLEPGMKYKYELIDAQGELSIKTDPYGLFFEAPPNNASVIWGIQDYQWSDNTWMEERATKDWKKEPISIYEVHLGSWKRVVEEQDRPLNYREIAIDLAQYVKEMGFTHIQFMPLAEHPFSGSWGYQVTGFFAPTQRYGTPQDFMFLVDHMHQNGIGILIDWVPAHFPRDAFALAKFDGTALYEHADPRQGEHQDWGTLIFNYDRHEVRNFITTSALSWFERFHVDGVRVDAVASMLYLNYSREEGEWIPNQYGGHENIGALATLRQTNDLIHTYYPGAITIAEESTSWSGVTKPTSEWGLGFDFKWNMGWMHDILRYFSNDPLNRKHHHHDLTFGMLYQYSENFISVFSHDEVVHGKCSMLRKMGSWFTSDKSKNLRALYAYMWGWPGKNTLFMGSEFGQSDEWYYAKSLDWHLLEYTDHNGIQKVVRDLNNLYTNNKWMAQHDNDPHGFQWIRADDADNSVISFIRQGNTPEETILVVGNFTPISRTNYRVGVPYAGLWKEILNTNAEIYGGNGEGNLGSKHTDEVEWDCRPCSLELHLPGLTTLFFKLDSGNGHRDTEAQNRAEESGNTLTHLQESTTPLIKNN